MLQDIVRDYLIKYPTDTDRLQLLQKQLADGDTLNDRKNFRGHAAGSAIVLSPDKKKVLMIHHHALNTWLHPGGHMDPGETDPADVARREAEEETGVAIASQIIVNDDTRMPIDIDTHHIPTNLNKNESDHYHHDFRYVFLAADMALVKEDHAIDDAAWVSFDDVRAGVLSRIIDRLRSENIILNT